ncbi:MAG TPA: type II toxin-antitoxin system ParD family antitoxin [Phycisphaerae bacterium]|nr:type II toxin-antitoxin system ParD family antitoxin [Phycisphaerae bacterium]
MKISLTKELEKYVQHEVESGRYGSSDEMIRAALRLMMEEEAELESIRAGIDESREQFRQGKGIPASEITVERIRNGAIKRFGHPRKKKAS